MRPTTRAFLGLAAAGAAGLAYAHWETTSFRLRHATAPVLDPGQAPLRVLHVSDLHMTPNRHEERSWVRGLRALHPDLVVVTGDFLAHPDAVPVVLDTLEPLMDVPGVFVLGSNDYYAPRPLNPARYLFGPSDIRDDLPTLPWPDLVAGLTSAGWHDLSNARAVVAAGGLRLDVRGVDDPHIRRDRYAEVAGPFDDRADLALGVAHAPYLRVLDAMAADGADLVLAGHTHGGQLCLPGFGALVTNCDLDRSRASGLSTHTSAQDPARTSWLHVSAGLGTSPYAPFRFACPPEATLLTLTARSVLGPVEALG
ncbi:MAG: metallophosphoesterase [Candidatus Nanopelagicales bacterium]